RTLPAIKKLAVEAMTEDYASREEAQRGIAGFLTDTYRKEHPEIYASRTTQVDAAIASVQDAYRRNIFPEMKAQWSEYPVNIGHFRNPGCMRCHDGNHVSDDGVVVTNDCRACHSILSQGSGDRLQVASTREGLDFEHPEDIGGLWEEVGCYECHSGVQP
ncbi:MAG: cytochrome C, partial [Acidobacteria bacterium]|nr:cytochrome C [Acidobacteriota bacterium]